MDNAVAADDPRLPPTYDNFGQNLADICSIARRAGAPVVLSTITVNLGGCPPFASDIERTCGPTRSHAWESIYRAGVELEQDSSGLKRWPSTSRQPGWTTASLSFKFRMGTSLAALSRLREAPSVSSPPAI